MAGIPRDGGIDRSLALLREGYEFIPNRCRRLGTDVFETRLMLQPAVCMSGAEAASEFYADARMTRRKALPVTVLTLLQDKGSAACLDGEAHRHRKDMFLGLTAPGRFDALLELAAAEWRAAGERWQRRAGVVLHSAAQEVLCRAVCTWAGVPLEESQVGKRTAEFAAMIDGAGAVGPRQWRGQVLRTRNEHWMRSLIEVIRRGEVAVPADSAAHVISWHRERDGELLDTAVAAVELINVLRPTVAVARYVTFAALALHDHPQAAERIRDGGGAEAEQFVQEVRRFYPFFPFVGGRVMEPFDWRGIHFPADRWVMLDLYGTNHDARVWDSPQLFRPERFEGWPGDPFTLIPQGAGDHRANHRCPGEWMTIALTRVALEFLCSSIDYRVPEQDLRVRLARMPAIPESGFRIDGVHPRV